DPDPQTFRRHLEVLRRLYNVVSLRDFVDALHDASTDKLPPKALVVTLDDGHRGNLRLKPVLERLGVPVTIFLCTGIVGTRRGFWFKHVDRPAELKQVPDEERLRLLREGGFDEPEELAEPEALSAEEILELQGPLVDFQSHTVSHPMLPHCSEAKA